MDSHERFDEQMSKFIDEVAPLDIASDQMTTAMKNLKTFSECRPPAPQPEPEPERVPETRREKVVATVARVLDNETTRVFLKGAASVIGVVVVTTATIKKDHVLERQAINQANQRQF